MIGWMVRMMMRTDILGMIVLLLFVLGSQADSQETQELCSGVPFELEIRSNDLAVSEHGPSRRIPYTATEQGRIYVHALSEDLDLWLRVEDGKGKVLVEDDDSGSLSHNAPPYSFVVNALVVVKE